MFIIVVALCFLFEGFIYFVYSPTTPDAFRINVIGAKDVRSPITQLGELTFLHVQKYTVWVVAVTKSNINAGLAFETLHQLITVFKSYFNGTFDEDSIRQNFALIYELLDGFAPLPLIPLLFHSISGLVLCSSSLFNSSPPGCPCPCF